MKFFTVLFAIATAAALFGMAAIYGASLRKSLMGNYEAVMEAARGSAAEFSSIDE